MGMAIDTDHFWTHGYLVVRNVFTRAEIESFRERAQASRHHAGDLLSNPALRDLVLDPRILRTAREILGETPVYFGDSNCVMGDVTTKFHKDNADRSDAAAPDWDGPYGVVRFAVYLQDHARHSGGVFVRDGSQNLPSTRGGRAIYLRTEVGDLALWSLRTTHSGNGVLFRPFPRWALPARQGEKLPRFLRVPHERERIALFTTFGRSGPSTERYIQYLESRRYGVSAWRHSRYDRDVWSAVEGRDLIVRDMEQEIRGLRGIGLNEKHAPIPY